jgi:predicted amidophosphoribosyltransferase
MDEIKFSDNYSDLCRESGVDAGFQFEFHCERCNDRWRTGFVAYRSGQASGWLSKAAGVFGGVLGNVGNAVDGLAHAGWSKARDEAFKAAVDEAKRHFHRCARCHQYICDICWNNEKGLCLNCAPSAEVEIEAARAQGEVYAAGEKATLEGIQRGKQMDVKRDRQLVCPQCGAETKGAKFCPECGGPLAIKSACPGCSAEVAPGTKFCPQCGAEMVQPALEVCPQCKKPTGGARFCPECGAKVERPAAAAPAKCPACGADAKGAKFCPECGAKMG